MRLSTRIMHVLRTIVPAPIARPILSYRSNRAYSQHLGATSADAFTSILENKAWGGKESASGAGSDLSSTELVRSNLLGFLQKLGVRSMLDTPCGDFHWMAKVDLDGISYIGGDIVPALIERNQQLYAATAGRRFIHADITSTDLPRCDLIMCRDCFIHLGFKDISAAIENFRQSGARYLLTTTYPLLPLNWDIRTGAFRPINLLKAPFKFPAPLGQLQENPPSPDLAGNPNFDRILGLWELAALPLFRG